MKTILITAMCLTVTAGVIAQTNSIMYPVNTNAPAYCTKTIVINAKPEKVWNVLTDIDQWNKWLAGVSESKLNGELKPNTSFDWKNGGTKIHSKLHTVDPYSNFGWTGKVYGIFAIHNWTFKAVNGATEITVSESMEGFLAKVLKKSLNKTLENEMTKSLESLKKACE